MTERPNDGRMTREERQRAHDEAKSSPRRGKKGAKKGEDKKAKKGK